MNSFNAQDEALSPEAVWREMRLHMEWNDGLSLCFLFAPDARAVASIQQWASDTWAMRTAPLRVLEPTHASTAAQEILRGMQEQARHLQARAPVWVQLTAIDGTEDAGWDQARAELLSRLNEAREWLVRKYARPLVLCLPAAWRTQVAQLAPDLWHIRSYSAKVQPVAATSAPAGLADTQNSSPQAVVMQQLNPVSANVADARARLSKKPADPALMRELIIALSEVGDVQLELGAITEALGIYRESLEICRQLRQALGDSPQVLRDLSVSLDNVGDAQAQAGQGAEALVAYRESLEICRQLRQALGDSPQVLRDLSVSLNNVGEAQAQAGQGAEALVAYRESLEICRQLRHALGDSPQVLRDLSVSLDNVGKAQAQAGQGTEALVAFRESLDIRRQLRQALGDSPQVLRDLSVSLNNVGEAQAQA
ncbi:tetratricopeptide (TPR) repeat protein, partial [Polaromonas sp. CG_9.5]|uniref:tetratricopeptide repeat protein n=1 Tax=Polaromonas sp. CG_9.5 TaxID=3071705 RepID=UPI002DFEA12B|nr:tetratricopeptide (TPR) repeat protein [Polaromonas sp. CG_9.5]